MFFIDAKAHGAKHEVLLPPLIVPLRCKPIVKNRPGPPYPLQRWEALNPLWDIEERHWTPTPGEIVVVAQIEYGFEWRFETHDVWKLSIVQDGRIRNYLWASHQIYVPSGSKINDWTDWWEIALNKEEV